MRVLLITRRLPPAICGVGDYTRHVARTLSKAGVEVAILLDAEQPEPDPEPGVELLRERFQWDTLAEAVGGWHPDWVSFQWVPHLYSLRGTSAGPARLLRELSRRGVGRHVVLHELWGEGGTWKQRVAGWLQRRATHKVIAGADRLCVPVEGWLERLQPAFPRPNWDCVPVGATLLPKSKPNYQSGAFGIFSPHGAGKDRETMEAVARSVLQSLPEARCYLIGHRVGGLSMEDHPRCTVVPPDTSETISKWLSQMGVLLCPFVDGVSGRRTSVVSALAHGVPVISNAGTLTDSFWSSSPVRLLATADSMAEEVSGILRDSRKQKELALASLGFYQRNLTWELLAQRQYGFLLPEAKRRMG